MRPTEAKLRADEALLKGVLKNLPENPIPWMAVLRIVGPLIARVAIRRALRRVNRGISDEKLNQVVTIVTDTIAKIIDRKAGG